MRLLIHVDFAKPTLEVVRTCRPAKVVPHLPIASAL